MEHYIDFDHYEMVITTGEVVLVVAVVLALVGVILKWKSIDPLKSGISIALAALLNALGLGLIFFVSPNSSQQLTNPLRIGQSGDITFQDTPLGYVGDGTVEATTEQGRAVNRVLTKAYEISKGKGYVSLEVSSKKAEAVLTMKKGKPYKIVSKIDSMKTVNADAKGVVKK